MSDDQAAVVRGVLGSTGDVNVIVGPAGTGKTTTMAVLSHAWQANGGSVLGLALSQTAANELAAATGGRAENIAKLLYETRRIDPEVFPGHAARWGLEAGQLVIMDEAGMTDRQAMVAVARLCEQAGAKLVLVGDHEQLESPEARGAMRLMAKVAETFELGRVHRFAHDWERDASLRLRAGDVEVLDEYAAHGRIYGGTAEANEQRAVRLALADHLAGRRVFILAGTNERAARVAGLFRDGLVAHGLVEAGGVRLGDGNLAGVGDRIVCRTNDRTLTTSRGSFVTNRSVYEVVARHTDGALTVAVVDPATGIADRDDWVALPAAYVAGNVVLEYAGTTHAAQGGTRCASHALISERDSINSVYVAMTRGRHSNVAHVDSEVEAGQDSEPRAQDPVAVLARILGREDSAEGVSALEARDLEVEKSKSLRTLFPIWQDLEGEHAKARWLASLSPGARHQLRLPADRLAGVAHPGRPPGRHRSRRRRPPNGAERLRSRLGVSTTPWTWPRCCTTACKATRAVGGAGRRATCAVLHPRPGRHRVRAGDATGRRADGPADRRAGRTSRPEPSGLGCRARAGPGRCGGPDGMDRPGRHRRLVSRSVRRRRRRPDRRGAPAGPARSTPLVERSPRGPRRRPAARTVGQRRGTGRAGRRRRPGGDGTPRPGPPGRGGQDRTRPTRRALLRLGPPAGAGRQPRRNR